MTIDIVLRNRIQSERLLNIVPDNTESLYQPTVSAAASGVAGNVPAIRRVACGTIRKEELLELIFMTGNRLKMKYRPCCLLIDT